MAQGWKPRLPLWPFPLLFQEELVWVEWGQEQHRDREKRSCVFRKEPTTHTAEHSALIQHGAWGRASAKGSESIHSFERPGYPAWLPPSPQIPQQ